MLSIWFMFDNHTFRRITATDRGGLIKQAWECFKKDGCGGLFVRDEFDATLDCLYLPGRRLLSGQYGVLKNEVESWADKVLSETSFRKMMIA